MPAALARVLDALGRCRRVQAAGTSRNLVVLLLRPAKRRTQSLDGWWGHCKKACSTVNAGFQDSVDDHVREAQWRHWTGDRDRWEAAADVISWLPAEGGDKA